MWRCTPIKNPRPIRRSPWKCSRPSCPVRGLAPWEPVGIKQVMTDLAEELGVKNAKVMWPVRIAIAGKAVTPGGAVEIAHILGKEESLARMKRGIEKLS